MGDGSGESGSERDKGWGKGEGDEGDIGLRGGGWEKGAGRGREGGFKGERKENEEGDWKKIGRGKISDKRVYFVNGGKGRRWRHKRGEN